MTIIGANKSIVSSHELSIFGLGVLCPASMLHSGLKSKKVPFREAIVLVSKSKINVFLIFSKYGVVLKGPLVE